MKPSGYKLEPNDYDQLKNPNIKNTAIKAYFWQPHKKPPSKLQGA